MTSYNVAHDFKWSDKEEKYRCRTCGCFTTEEMGMCYKVEYVGDNNRQEPDERILRELGHFLKD